MDEDESRIERELAEYRRLALGAAGAKRDLGLKGSKMELRFFEEIWPKVVTYLRATGFSLDE